MKQDLTQIDSQIAAWSEVIEEVTTSSTKQVHMHAMEYVGPIMAEFPKVLAAITGGLGALQSIMDVIDKVGVEPIFKAFGLLEQKKEAMNISDAEFDMLLKTADFENSPLVKEANALGWLARSMPILGNIFEIYVAFKAIVYSVWEFLKVDWTAGKSIGLSNTDILWPGRWPHVSSTLAKQVKQNNKDPITLRKIASVSRAFKTLFSEASAVFFVGMELLLEILVAVAMGSSVIAGFLTGPFGAVLGFLISFALNLGGGLALGAIDNRVRQVVTADLIKIEQAIYKIATVKIEDLIKAKSSAYNLDTERMKAPGFNQSETERIRVPSFGQPKESPETPKRLVAPRFEMPEVA